MDIYEEMKNDCKDFSKSRLNRNIVFIKTLMILGKPFYLWLIDLLIWLIVPGLFVAAGLFPLNLMTFLLFWITHMIYWKYIGEKNSKELLVDLDPEKLKLAYKALIEVKAQKFGKNKQP